MGVLVPLRSQTTSFFLSFSLSLSRSLFFALFLALSLALLAPSLDLSLSLFLALRSAIVQLQKPLPFSGDGGGTAEPRNSENAPVFPSRISYQFTDEGKRQPMIHHGCTRDEEKTPNTEERLRLMAEREAHRSTRGETRPAACQLSSYYYY